MAGGIGDQDPNTAARRQAVPEDFPDPPTNVRCDRCRAGGLLPVAYVTSDGRPALGVACCNCAWGSYYYAVFKKQAMQPTYYDNWPAENVNKDLVEFHEVNDDAKRRYHRFKRDLDLPFMDEDGNWVNRKTKEEKPDDPDTDEDDIPV